MKQLKPLPHATNGQISHEHNHPTGGRLVELNIGDFIPLPAKSLNYRGVIITRATAIRAINSGMLKSRLFRQPGSTQGRRYLLRDSLNTYLDACMADVATPTIINSGRSSEETEKGPISKAPRSSSGKATGALNQP